VLLILLSMSALAQEPDKPAGAPGGEVEGAEATERERTASEDDEDYVEEAIGEEEMTVDEAGEEEIVYPPVLIPPALTEAVALPWPPGEPPQVQIVKLGILIDEEGAVIDAIALDGVLAFSDAALSVVKDFHFTPCIFDGEPIMVQYPFELTFEPPPINAVGVVQMGGSRDPLPGVNIRIGPFLAETDEEGRFEIRGLEPGEHTVKIISSLWRAPDQVFTLEEGQKAEMEIWVRPTGTIVEAMGTYVRGQGEILVHTLTAEEVRTTPGTMGDPVRAVQNLPGVVKAPLESGWLLVRGGDPEDTGLFVDGIRVPLVYHLGGFTSVINPAFIQQVDYMPGGYSARYGRTSAGVVDLQTSPLVDVKSRAEVGIDLVNASVYSQFPVGDGGGGAIAVRRSYLDRAIALAVDDDAAQIAPRFWDWQARADGKNGGVFMLGFTDQIDAPTGEDDETVTITVGTQRFHGRIESELTDDLSLLFQPFAALEWYNIELDSGQYRESTVGGARAELNLDRGQSGALLGIDAELSDYDLRIDDSVEDFSDGERVADTRYSSLDPYVHGFWGWPDEVQVEAGLRLDTLKLDGQYWRTGISPRLQLSVPVAEGITFVGDAGLYHQPPPIDLAAALPAGPSLELERSFGPGGGVRLRRGNIRFQSDLYWRKLDQVTLFENDGSLVQGDGVAYGWENMFRWSSGNFSGWTAYTWSRSWRREDPEQEPELWLPHSFDQPHYLIQVLSWQLPRDWSLAARWRAGSGYPWSTSRDTAFDLLTQTEYPLEPDIYLRLQPFHSLDLKISKRVVFRAWRLEFYLDGQNLYNRRIPEPVITGVDDSDWYSYGLPTLPIFGVKGVFWP